jgi:hypothetical protein
MKKKKRPKVICRECLFFNKDNRCDLRKTEQALAPGRKRRCHQFSNRFVKKTDVIERPREVLPKQIVDVLLPEEEIHSSSSSSSSICPALEIKEDVKMATELPNCKDEENSDSVNREILDKGRDVIKDFDDSQEICVGTELEVASAPEEIAETTKEPEETIEPEKTIGPEKETISKKESFFKRLFGKR